MDFKAESLKGQPKFRANEMLRNHVFNLMCSVTQLCLTLCNPMDCIAHQALLSMRFPRQEHWIGLPFPPPGTFLTQESNPHLRKASFNLTVRDKLEFCSLLMEKTMAPQSSTLAWKIPWTEQPGRLQSMELLRVGHN